MSTATRPISHPRVPRRTLLVLVGLFVVIAAAIIVPLLVLRGGSTPQPAQPPTSVVHTGSLQPAPDPCEASTIGRPRPC